MNNYRFYFCVGSIRLDRDNINAYKSWAKDQNNLELWLDEEKLYLLNEIKYPNFEEAWFKHHEQSHMRIMYRHRELWVFHKWQGNIKFEADVAFDHGMIGLNEEANAYEEYDLQNALEEVEYEIYCKGDKIEECDLYCDEFIDDLFEPSIYH